MTLAVRVVPVTPYQQNCSVVKCEATGRAAIVDPGGDIERILAAVEAMSATVEKILLTHGHPVPGCSVNLAVQLLLVPFAWQTGAYDMVTLSGEFGVINTQALLSHLS